MTLQVRSICIAKRATCEGKTAKTPGKLRAIHELSSQLRSFAASQLISQCIWIEPQTIDLSGNRIGYVGAAALAEAVRTSTTLQTIDLSRKIIGDVGAAALAEALRTNTTLQTINLKNNEIGAAAAAALAEALRTNTTLQIMNLQYNGFGLEGVESLAHALENNFSLQNLGFDQPKLSGLLGRNKRYQEHLLHVEKHGHDYHLGLLPLVLSKAWIPLPDRSGLIQKHPDIFQ